MTPGRGPATRVYFSIWQPRPKPAGRCSTRLTITQHCSLRDFFGVPRLSAGRTISHSRRSPASNRWLEIQRNPSLLRFSVAVSTAGFPTPPNKRTGQWTGTRTRFRRSPAKAMCLLYLCPLTRPSGCLPTYLLFSRLLDLANSPSFQLDSSLSITGRFAQGDLRKLH